MDPSEVELEMIWLVLVCFCAILQSWVLKHFTSESNIMSVVRDKARKNSALIFGKSNFQMSSSQSITLRTPSQSLEGRESASRRTNTFEAFSRLPSSSTWVRSAMVERQTFTSNNTWLPRLMVNISKNNRQAFMLFSQFSEPLNFSIEGNSTIIWNCNLHWEILFTQVLTREEILFAKGIQTVTKS